MEITIEELNELLQKEFERGKHSNDTQISYPETNKNYIGVPVVKPDISVKEYIPNVCKNCPNLPSNGGNGVCNCVMPYMTYTSVVTNNLSTSESISTKDYGEYMVYTTC